MPIHKGVRLSFSGFSRHFADFICRFSHHDSAELWLAAAVVSERSLSGHLFTDLSAIAGRSINELVPEAPVGELFPVWPQWLEEISGAAAIGTEGEIAPLILDSQGVLYLHKFWSQQKHCAERLLSRAGHLTSAVDLALLRDGLQRLFPDTDDPNDLQKWAVACGICRKLLILSGGPGTGKTTTIVKLMALLLEQAEGRPLRVALAAPTGKAAQRVKGALARDRSSLNCREEIKQALPGEALTLHRLLESTGSGQSFRYNRDNPLPTDVLIIDEASMIDLAMMNRILDALPSTARLVLVGDRNQLASVEPGSVFGDLCVTASEGGYSSKTKQLARDLGMNAENSSCNEGRSPLSDCFVTLEKNHRFAEARGIASLCEGIQQGDISQAVDFLLKNQYDDVRWQPFPERAEQLHAVLQAWLSSHLLSLFQADSVVAALAMLDRGIVLTPLRQGRFGVDGINRTIEELLRREKLIPAGEDCYRGQPIMVLRNDYRLQLFNGDVGVLWPDPDRSGELRAFFKDGQGDLRSYAISLLPSFGTAYAMTIHKSQGSEFERVQLLVPACSPGVINRELIYTAISRARKSVEIIADVDVLTAGLDRPMVRESALNKFILNAPDAVS